jgi:hypothetical protein
MTHWKLSNSLCKLTETSQSLRQPWATSLFPFTRYCSHTPALIPCITWRTPSPDVTAPFRKLLISRRKWNQLTARYLITSISTTEWLVMQQSWNVGEHPAFGAALHDLKKLSCVTFLLCELSTIFVQLFYASICLTVNEKQNIFCSWNLYILLLRLISSPYIPMKQATKLLLSD